MDDEEKQRLLDLYIHDYMVKKGMHDTASTFAAEANFIPPNTVAMDDVFFTAWWRKAYEILNTEVPWPEHIPQPQEPNYRERLRQGIGIHIPDFPQMPEEQSASDSLVQGQSSTSSDTDTNLQTEPTPDAPTDNSSRPIEPNTSDEGTSNQSTNIQTEPTPNAPTDESSSPMPKASDAAINDGSFTAWWRKTYEILNTEVPWPEHIPLPQQLSVNMQTEPTPNVPTDDSSRPKPKASDAGTSNQSRNLQTEATPNAPTDDSLRPMPRTSGAGSSSQSNS